MIARLQKASRTLRLRPVSFAQRNPSRTSPRLGTPRSFEASLRPPCREVRRTGADLRGVPLATSHKMRMLHLGLRAWRSGLPASPSARPCDRTTSMRSNERRPIQAIRIQTNCEQQGETCAHASIPQLHVAARLCSRIGPPFVRPASVGEGVCARLASRSWALRYPSSHLVPLLCTPLFFSRGLIRPTLPACSITSPRPPSGAAYTNHCPKMLRSACACCARHDKPFDAKRADPTYRTPKQTCT